jgi:hypothetical protein
MFLLTIRPSPLNDIMQYYFLRFYRNHGNAEIKAHVAALIRHGRPTRFLARISTVKSVYVARQQGQGVLGTFRCTLSKYLTIQSL